MDKLIPEVLYSNNNNNSFHEHHIKDLINNEQDVPDDLEDPDSVWEKAADRIKKYDPRGIKAFYLLRELERQK